MSEELRLIRRITLKLIPFLILLYLIAYVDRSAVGFAKLHMGADVGIGDAAYGLGAGLFFIGYFLFEIPSNLMLDRFGARRWFARIMITWGAITIGMAFVQGPHSFYVMRFLLGAAEAGFFPGVLYYITQWFPVRHRGKILGLFIPLPADRDDDHRPRLGRPAGHGRHLRPARLAVAVHRDRYAGDPADLAGAALPAGRPETSQVDERRRKGLVDW